MRFKLLASALAAIAVTVAVAAGRTPGEEDRRPEAAMRAKIARSAAGIIHSLEITSNVLYALRKDSARRAKLFDAMRDRDLREEYKHWGGVIGYRAYNRFEAGQTRYFSHRLRKPR